VTVVGSLSGMALHPRIGMSLGSRRHEESAKDVHLRARCVAFVSLSY
jgi:hypothetical protein